MKSPKYDDDTLLCPHCGGNNLHQKSVWAFFRTEDAERGVVGHVSDIGGGVFTDADMEGNPSDRRDGITIKFECENCHGEPNGDRDRPPFALNIIQHKGLTWILWGK